MAWRVGQFVAGHRSDGASQRGGVPARRQADEHLACQHAAGPFRSRRVLRIKHEVADVGVPHGLRTEPGGNPAGDGFSAVKGQVVQLTFRDDIDYGLT